ncbi:mCG1030462, partial [Mus musculus]
MANAKAWSRTHVVGATARNCGGSLRDWSLVTFWTPLNPESTLCHTQ